MISNFPTVRIAPQHRPDPPRDLTPEENPGHPHDLGKSRHDRETRPKYLSWPESAT
jgi:hypothetical protein